MKLAAQMPAGSPQPDQEGAETEAAAAAVAEPGIPGHEAGEAAASTGQLLQQAPVPTLDPAAAAAMGLTPEQQEQMQQLMLQQMPLATLSHEALAAMPALPLVGASGEMPQVALDPAALAAMNVPILGPDGNQLTPEQVALVFGGNPTGFPWLLPPGAVLAGMPVASPASVESGYKNWWEEHEEKVGCGHGHESSCSEASAAARARPASCTDAATLAAGPGVACLLQFASGHLPWHFSLDSIVPHTVWCHGPSLF